MKEFVDRGAPKKGVYTTEHFEGENLLWYTTLNEVPPFKKEVTRVELKYMIHGECDYIIDGKHVKLQKERFYIINKGHTYEGYSNFQVSPFKGLFFFIDNQLLSEAYYAITNTNATLLDNPKSVESEEPYFFEYDFHVDSNELGKFLQLLGESIMQDNGKSLNPSLAFHELVLKLLEAQGSINTQLLNIRAEKKSTKDELLKRLMVSKELINSHQDYNFKISELASEIALSEFHFYRTFKQAFGVSPYQYIIDTKLDYSKKIMRTSEKSISEIAMHLGFADLATFSKAFKKRFKVPPSFYNKSLCTLYNSSPLDSNTSKPAHEALLNN